jgi:hypothetical protein
MHARSAPAASAGSTTTENIIAGKTTSRFDAQNVLRNHASLREAAVSPLYNPKIPEAELARILRAVAAGLEQRG